jgi:hypothetical protein
MVGWTTTRGATRPRLRRPGSVNTTTCVARPRCSSEDRTPSDLVAARSRGRGPKRGQISALPGDRPGFARTSVQAPRFSRDPRLRRSFCLS